MVYRMMTNTHTAILLLAAAGLLPVALSGPACHGQTLETQSAVQSGRDALTERANFPWYDEDSDSIRRIDVRTPKEPAAHRNSTWQAKPYQPKAASSRPTVRRSFLGGLVQTVVWGGLLCLLAILIALLVRAFINAEPVRNEQVVPDEPRSEEDLIENLPFDVGRPQTNLLSEARRHYEQGAYGEAIIYLFSYQLVRLDQHHLIRVTRGKTNRQYLGELVSRPGLHAMLGRTMVAFEDVFFGEHVLDRKRFEDCWLGLDEFHRRLDEGAV